MNNILVFIPDNLEKNNVGILEGFTKTIDNNLTFYITNNKLLRASSSAVGYCGENKPSSYLTSIKVSSEWIFINAKDGTINIFSKDTENVSLSKNIIIIKYDYNTFKYSSISSIRHQTYGDYFETLVKAIQYKQNVKKSSLLYLLYLFSINVCLLFLNGFLKVYKLFSAYLRYSATATHLNSNATSLKWVLLQLKKEQKISLGVGNLLVSRITDLMCGLVLLYFVIAHESELQAFVSHITENIIESLEYLLNFLMGSPVGLKLNHALNKTLGNFFLYHISLWRTFLHTCAPLIKLGLHLLVIPGAFGLSFQAALLSDIIAFSTLHVYCIYVYAARLYGIQVQGLISLWRLFIGRKYNPLRGRVDSYQYNHHQLVIGTLGFTVLVFLLPTTLLYYTVFSVFRAGLVAFDGVLIRLRYVLQCLPIYVFVLWIVNSSKVKGAVRLTINPTHELGVVHATLDTLSLWQSIVNSVPISVSKMPSMSWSFFFRSFTSGSLL